MSRLKETALLFARLGITAFGGPAAHIAMMRREVVENKRWMADSDFLDMVGATNLIPGPNSTELAIHIGKERAGWKGLVVAGLLFIIPAVAITTLLAWLYKQYGTLPEISPFVYGIKPAIIAVVLLAILPLAKIAARNTDLLVLGIACLILSLVVNEIAVLFGAGTLYMLYKAASKRTLPVLLPILAIPGMGYTGLFFSFLKIGATLYGSGYVLFAFIDSEFVSAGLLSRQQLVDAIAVGQVTPGPVFSSAAFVGYQINGFWGAMAATAGIFVPSFVFVALLHKLITWLKGSATFKAFLDAVNVASVAVMCVVCLKMGKDSITSWQTALIFGLSIFILLIRPKINSALIVVFGSLSGYLLSYL